MTDQLTNVDLPVRRRSYLSVLLQSVVVILIVMVVVILLIPAVQNRRENRADSWSTHRMLEIGHALIIYNEFIGSLPASAIRDPQGRALLSWRVALLPFLEQGDLYEQFKLNEPWDSPHNIKLLPKMPRVYATWGRLNSANEFKTHFRVFHGRGAAFDGSKGLNIENDFIDGASNTILFVEADEAVPWTKPDELEYDADRPLPKLGELWRNRFYVCMADGRVIAVPKVVSERSLRAAIERGDGEISGMLFR